jgi:8-oxo-dGTP pyrophosphatase MutT (NUDIX family)
VIESAVLVPVYRRDGDVRLIVIRRAEGGVHGGQLAFPGGKREPEDATLHDTAVREAREEIGLDGGVELLEQLPDSGTLTSGFRVTPFLARIDPPAAWRLDEREVAEVLDVRVADLDHPRAHGEEMKSFATWKVPRLIPFYRVGRHKLWGLTYRILRPLVPRLLAGEWRI